MSTGSRSLGPCGGGACPRAVPGYRCRGPAVAAMVKETIRVYARVKPLGRRQQAGVGWELCPGGCAGDAGESRGLAGGPRSPLRCGRRSGAHPLQEARATGGGGEAGTRVGVRREVSAVRSLKFIKSLSGVV